MDFGDVIKGMKADTSRRFARSGWKDDTYIHITDDPIRIDNPDALAGMACDEAECISVKTRPHIELVFKGSPVFGGSVSDADILADDWMEV